MDEIEFFFHQPRKSFIIIWAKLGERGEGLFVLKQTGINYLKLLMICTFYIVFFVCRASKTASGVPKKDCPFFSEFLLKLFQHAKSWREKLTFLFVLQSCISKTFFVETFHILSYKRSKILENVLLSQGRFLGRPFETLVCILPVI